MLLVGLGGGSLVKSFDRTGWSIDAVEIDPVVVEVAYEFFGLEPREARVYTMDGRQYLLTHEKTYDLVILDAFGSSSIPFHLVTREAFGLIKERLAPGGVLAINIEARHWFDKIVRALGITLHRHFEHVRALPLSEPRTAFGNLVILASDRELDFPEGMLGRPSEFLDDPYWHWVVVTRNHAWDNRFDPRIPGGVPILTDELNPVDVWAEEINLEARRELHSDRDWARRTY
jgi:predicted membrane-bound spermidine synthase